jgi:hypothetical protein
MTKPYLRRLLSYLFVLVLPFISEACAIVKSNKVDLTANPGDQIDTQNKIPYFLPTGRLRLQLAENTDTTQCELAVSVVYVPDINNLYFVEYNPSVFSNDKLVKIGIGTNGLLKTIETQTEDTSSQVLAKLVELGKIVALRLPSPVPAAKREVPCQLDVTFDPLEIHKEKYKDLREQISNRLQAFDPEVSGFEIVLAHEPSQLPKWGGSRPKSIDGVVHRPLLPYFFQLKTKDGLVSLAPQIVYLPNEAPFFTIDIKRRAFIDHKYTLSFTDGILTEVSWVKPSEALGFVQIPVDIAKAIVAIPAEMLTVKVNNAKAEADLLNAQKSLLDARDELRKRIEELEAARKGQSTP